MERINRANDRRCYQPKLRAETVHRLWEAKEATGRPMTVLLEKAVASYLSELSLAYEELLIESGFAPTVFFKRPDEEEWHPMLPGVSYSKGGR